MATKYEMPTHLCDGIIESHIRQPWDRTKPLIAESELDRSMGFGILPRPLSDQNHDTKNEVARWFDPVPQVVQVGKHLTLHHPKVSQHEIIQRVEEFNPESFLCGMPDCAGCRALEEVGGYWVFDQEGENRIEYVLPF